MKVPLSVAMSLILPLILLIFVSAFILCLGAEWTEGVLAACFTLLAWIFVPCSLLAMTGRILDDRRESLEQVSLCSNGSFPEPLLRGIYNGCAGLLCASTGVLIVAAVFYWSGRAEISFFSVRGIVNDPLPVLLAACIAGFAFSVVLSRLWSPKVGQLERLPLICAAIFLLTGILSAVLSLMSSSGDQ